MATVNVKPSRVTLTLSHDQAGKLLDLLAGEAASQPWAEELFNALAGEQPKPA